MSTPTSTEEPTPPARSDGPTTALPRQDTHQTSWAQQPGGEWAQQPDGGWVQQPGGGWVQQPPRGPVGPHTSLPKAQPSGPGATTPGIVVALALLTLAVLMYLERVGLFGGPVLLTAGAIGIVLAGLAIVVSGLRGRTSGVLGFLAVVAILVVGPGLAVSQHDWRWDGSSNAVGELLHTPRTIAQAETGFSLGAGEARIDLTELPASSTVVEVPISVGAGELTVVLPQDGDYQADIRVFAGEVRWLGDTVTQAGVGRSSSYVSDSVAAGADADLVLNITVGAGSVLVIEE